MPARWPPATALAGLFLIGASPGRGDDATSRALTVFNLPDVPPGPIVEAVSRPLTVFNLPDVPPDPIAEVVSRPLTVFNLPDTPPVLATEAISRPVTVHCDPQSSVLEPVGPPVFALHQARPNPFSPWTTLSYVLAEAGRVTMVVYDLRGTRVATLVDAIQFPGEQHVEWTGLSDTGDSVPSGVYFVRLTTPGGIRTQKVTLSR